MLLLVPLIVSPFLYPSGFLAGYFSILVFLHLLLLSYHPQKSLFLLVLHLDLLLFFNFRDPDSSLVFSVDINVIAKEEFHFMLI